MDQTDFTPEELDEFLSDFAIAPKTDADQMSGPVLLCGREPQKCGFVIGAYVNVLLSQKHPNTILFQIAETDSERAAAYRLGVNGAYGGDASRIQPGKNSKALGQFLADYAGQFAPLVQVDGTRFFRIDLLGPADHIVDSDGTETADNDESDEGDEE